MCLSLMRIKYDDFEIEDDYKSYLFEVSCQFVQNFYDSYPRWGPLEFQALTDKQEVLCGLQSVNFELLHLSAKGSCCLERT